MSLAVRHRRVVGLVVAVAGLTASGCSHGARATTKPSPPATFPSPSPSPSLNEEAMATSQAIAAYKATFLDVNEAVSHRNSSDPALMRHSGSSALAFFAATARFYITQDVTLKGMPALRLQVVSTSLTATPPNVLLQACVDPRAQQHLDRQTGRPAAGFILKPRPQAVLVQQRQERWLVDAVKADPKRTC